MEFLALDQFFLTILRLFGLILIVLTIIFIHEIGHYLVGRWCGIKAAAFSLGFGPELFSFQDKRGTIWRLALFPIGGYVRFVGDEDFSSSPSEKQQSPVAGSFAEASALKCALTIFAGPLANAVLSLLIFSFLFFVSGRIVVEPVIGSVIDGMPAKNAGLKKGDRILAIDGERVSSFEDLTQKISLEAGQSLHFLISRQGQIFEKEIIPQSVARDTGLNKKLTIGLIGIAPMRNPAHPNFLDKRYVTIEQYNVFQAVRKAYNQVELIISQSLKVLGRLVIGKADRCQLSGPTQTISIAWQVSAFGWLSLLNFMAILSLGVGIINLLPIPPLDGGQLFFYIWEVLFRRPVVPSIKQLIYKLGGMMVLALMLFAFVNDFIAC